jgi:hypothetical protein
MTGQHTLFCYFLDNKTIEDKEDKNKDQQGKGNVHRTQPPTHPSRAPRSHQTKTRSGRTQGLSEACIYLLKTIPLSFELHFYYIDYIEYIPGLKYI